MTDDAVHLAREAGLTTMSADSRIAKFAALAHRAGVLAERARCAKIASEWDKSHPDTNYGGCIARLIEESK